MYVQSRRRELSAALAAAFLAGAWTEDALARRGAEALDPRPRWLRAVARAVLAAYHRPPLDRPRELAAYIELQLREPRSDRPPPRVRRWLAFEPEMARTPWPVPAIESPGALAEWLRSDPAQLAWLADARGLERHVTEPRLRRYTYAWLPRPAGGPARVIEAPKARLKAIQRQILHAILDRVPAHDAAHGFVPGRSVRTHAALHTGRALVLRLDLEDFFACVSAARVFAIFRTAGYPEAVAHALTALTTNVVPRDAWHAVRAPDPRAYRLGRRLATPHLPQGAPTSPALASLAAFRLDARLNGLARATGTTYSRYADDLTFSGDRPPVGLLIGATTEIARAEGFRIGAAKTRVRSRAARQLVAGVVVNEHLNVPRREYDRLKALLHDAASHGPQAANRAGVPDLRAHVRGRIAWVAAINPERGRRLLERFDAVAW